MICSVCGRETMTVYSGDICPECWEKKEEQMKTQEELRDVGRSFRFLYAILPDGDIYEKLSLVERVIDWVLGD